MKKLVASLILSLSMFSLAWALTSEEQQSITDLIDPPLQNYIATTLEASEPLEELQDKVAEIEGYLEDEGLSETSIYGLEYLLEKLEDTIDTILAELQEEEETEEETEPEEPQEPLVTIDVSDYQDGEKSILAGKESAPIMELEYTAQYEDIMIEDLEISWGGDMWNFIELVRIYNETGVLLWEYMPLSDGYIMQNVNMLVPEGTQKFYVTLQPYKIGKESVGEQVTRTFNFTVREAVGQTTNEEIDSFWSTQTSDDINIVPVLITKIEFLDEAHGYKVVDQLTDGVSQNLALLAITAGTWENTFSNNKTVVWLALESIRFTIQETIENNLSSSISLRRIDSSDQQSVTPSTLWSSFAEFDMSAEDDSISLIESGETAVYLIRWDVSLFDNGNSVKIYLEDLDSGNITYRSEDPSSKLITELLLESEYLDNVTLTD